MTADLVARASIDFLIDLFAEDLSAVKLQTTLWEGALHTNVFNLLNSCLVKEAE